MPLVSRTPGQLLSADRLLDVGDGNGLTVHDAAKRILASPIQAGMDAAPLNIANQYALVLRFLKIHTCAVRRPR